MKLQIFLSGGLLRKFICTVYKLPKKHLLNEIHNLWQNNWSDNDASHNNCAEISILMNYKLISYVACIIVPETGEIMKLIELVLVRSVTLVKIEVSTSTYDLIELCRRTPILPEMLVCRRADIA